MSDVRRSRETVEVVINGQKASLAHSVKKFSGTLVYWYFIKFSCGGWREFDIRWLPDIDADVFWKDSMAWLQQGGHENSLKQVATLLSNSGVDIFDLILKRDANNH